MRLRKAANYETRLGRRIATVLYTVPAIVCWAILLIFWGILFAYEDGKALLKDIKRVWDQ